VEQHYLRYIEEWDDASFRQFVEQYSRDVWNYAYFMTKRREVADDIAQEVFIKAYYQISQFRGQSTMKTWLLSMARNMSLNYFRSAFIRKVTLVDLFSSNETSSSAEQEVLDQLASKQIWKIVLGLPRKHREALLLDVHYGLSCKEIASLLGIAEGTVKSRLSRARSKVNECLKEEELNYESI